MSMHNFNALPDNDVSENGEERKDRRKSGLSVNDPKRDIIDFDPVGEVSDAGSTLVCVCDDDDFVTTVDEFLLRGYALD